MIRPRSVFCPTRHHHRSRKVADDACAGRFTHGGITLELGVEPDWLGAPLPPDKEWRIAWSKFYYGLDLAHAFGERGGARYLETWERLVGSWIERVPVGADSSDVAGRRVQNWIYAWDAFASSARFAGLADGLDEQIAGSVRDQARFVRENLTAARNHRTLELYALFVVGLAFPDPELVEFAMGELHRNLLTEVRPDGVHIEASTHYHMIALRSFLAARENARRFGLRFPPAFDARLERACEFALHCHRPDGEIPALSDSDTGSYLDLLELAASLLGRPDFRWGATTGSDGAPPARRNASFPAGGYFVQRSGWGQGVTRFEDERFLIFDCGPLGAGGHGHYDLLNVEVAAGGRPLVVDPGRYTYSELPGPNLRRWFKGTAAHNTVCVDGLEQTPYARSKPSGPIAEGRLLDRWSAPSLDLLHGEVRSPCYDAVHRRRIIFVADEYWIVEDRLRGRRAHSYDLRYHLAPDAWQATHVEPRDDHAVVRCPGLGLVIASVAEPALEAGWVSREYGVKARAPVVSVTVDGSASATFLTLVVPLADGRKAPYLLLGRVHGGHPLVRAEVEGVGPAGQARDELVWSDSWEEPHLGRQSSRAPVEWVRTSSNGGSPEGRLDPAARAGGS